MRLSPYTAAGVILLAFSVVALFSIGAAASIISGLAGLLFAVRAEGGSFFLYDAGEGDGAAPMFVIRGDGKLRFSFGTETRWKADDLKDTGWELAHEHDEIGLTAEDTPE